MGDESSRRDRRVYAAAVLTGVGSGALVFLAASRTWASVEVAPPGMTADTVTVTGSAAAPLVGAMAFVVMAGSVAVVASSGWLRRAVGALVVVAAVVAVYTAATAGGAVDDALSDAVASSTSMTAGPEQQRELVADADATWWRWGAVAGSLAALGVGCLVVVRGGRWPGMGRRYDAPSARRRESAEPAEERDVTDLWKALDEGEDPTARD